MTDGDGVVVVVGVVEATAGVVVAEVAGVGVLEVVDGAALGLVAVVDGEGDAGADDAVVELELDEVTVLEGAPGTALVAEAELGDGPGDGLGAGLGVGLGVGGAGGGHVGSRELFESSRN